MTIEQDAKALCQRMEGDIEPLEHRLRLAEWSAECTGSPAAFAEVKQLRRQVMDRLANRDDFGTAERLLGGAGALEAKLRRQVFRWRNRLAGNQVDAATIAQLAAEETELVQQYNAFRAELAGQPVGDNEIDRILAESRSNAECASAWRASKRIADYRGPGGDAPSVAERLLDLVRLRNSAAKQIGYPNSHRAHLELGELDSQWLFEFLDVLERETRGPFQEWKTSLDAQRAQRFAVSAAELRPWHYGDRFFQQPPQTADDVLDKQLKTRDAVQMTIQTFDELGFDVRPIIARSDLFPGDPATSRKCQHAFCTTIQAPNDVRVLCNVVPGERWTSTMLHEFGHAIYGASLDPALPYILRDDPHTLCNEAIALLMERHLLDAGWLERIAGFAKQDGGQVARKSRRRLAEKHLVFTRWVLVMCHFERALYEDPNRDDLGGLWWELVAKYQRVSPPERDRKAHDWAAKIHFVGHPAYYQNYLLGEVFGAQLEEAIRAECGELVGNAHAGMWLRDRMFRPGATFHWNELLKWLTGKSMGPEAFLRVIRSALAAT